MKIIATPCLGKDLKPGELFSTVGQAYWNTMENRKSIGEKVFVRTNNPCEKDDADYPLYRLEIVSENRDSTSQGTVDHIDRPAPPLGVVLMIDPHLEHEMSRWEGEGGCHA